MMTTKSLSLCTLTQEQHEKTCGYWYLVHESHGPHTAFRTREALMRWLSERGLALTKPLPSHGEHSFQYIEGNYARRYIRSVDDIVSCIENQILILDNAEYTDAYVTHEDGLRVVNIVTRGNPRLVFDYHLAQAHFDSGKPGFPGVTFSA
jgi:hypothetical protein